MAMSQISPVQVAFETVVRTALEGARAAKRHGERDGLQAYHDILTVAKEQMGLLEIEFHDKELNDFDPYDLMKP